MDKNTVVVNGNRIEKIRIKSIIAVVLVVLVIVSLYNIILIQTVNKKFAEEVTEFYKFNANTIFSIDKIFMYSSAGALENTEKRAIWNLNLYQYTDIAIYINNKSGKKLTSENSIKSLYIDNIKFGSVQEGNPKLYFKNVNEFGKCILKVDEDSQSQKKTESISDKLDYTIVNDGEIDYTKPQIYADASNPITLEYVNKDIKKNQIISDISQNLTYNGSILRQSGIVLSTISNYVSFNVNIINQYDQKFVANVYIDIPLEDTITGDTIYNGKFEKTLQKSNYIKFYRTK